MHVCVSVCKCTHIRTHTHTRAHTYTNTHSLAHTYIIFTYNTYVSCVYINLYLNIYT